jgi:hypothetical protein
MSIERFEDDCPGCRPCLIDVKTGQIMGEDEPPMRAAMRVWRATSRFEREAFHRVCCLNSRNPVDLQVIQSISGRIKAQLEAH